MKNRRNIIVAFLLCACLLVGIGYANLTTSLYLKGTSKITSELAEEKFDTDIVWASAVSSNTEKVTAELDSTSDTVQITAAGLDTLNEEITVTCIMVNNSADTNAWVTIPAYSTAGDAGEYIEVTRVQTGYTSDTASTTTTLNTTDAAQSNAFYLEANGGTAEVVITFKLIKSFVPTDALVEVSSQFNLEFVVTAISNANP